MPSYDNLQRADPEIYAAVSAERRRQARGLELIASENFVSPAVLEAAGSVLTNKYAEGYPGRRYYGGCEVVDTVERLARKRAKKLFGAAHANVQPHSGTTANMAVYFAFLKPGDKLMGMDLSCGGHLTHGHHLSYSGRDFTVVSYGVDRQTEQIDYEDYHIKGAYEVTAFQTEPGAMARTISAVTSVGAFFPGTAAVVMTTSL